MKKKCFIKKLAVSAAFLFLTACGGDGDGGGESPAVGLVANDDSATTIENVAVIIDVVGNDNGLTDMAYVINVSVNANKGSTDIIDDSIRYTPNNGVFGADSFEYTVTDSDGESASATVVVTITEAANAIPVANDDAASTAQDTMVMVNVLANDTGLEDTPYTLSVSANANRGSTDIIGDSIRYTPNNGVSGTDSFEYTVTDSDGESALATVMVTIAVSGASVISALTVFDTANASDWSIKSDLQTGDDMHGDRTYTFAEIPANLVGQEWLSTANDSKLFPGNVAQFTVTTNAEVFVVHSDTISTKPDWLSNNWVDTGDNIVNSEPNTYSIYRRTFTAGSMVVLGENGGTDQGMYVVVINGGANSVPKASNDSASTSGVNTVTINVTDNDSGLDNAPYGLAVSRNASSGITQVIDNDNILYDPNSEFDGTDSFEYTVTDSDGESSIATVTVTVTVPGAAIPVANDDAASTVQNTTIIVDVVANDSGLEDTPYVVSVTANATDGTAAVVDTDKVQYIPGSGFSGTDNFTYTITDIDGEFATATVTITVTAGGNATPVANIDVATTLQNQAVVIDVLGNDTGLEDTPLTLNVDSADNGSLNVLESFDIRYTPNIGFSGKDDFNYTVTDIDGDIAVANVEVTVNCVDCALNTAVILSWNPKLEADVVSSYEIYFAKATDAADATVLLQTLFVSSSGFDPSNPAVTFDAWEDLKLNKGDNLCFRLKARNAEGASGFSNGICGQIPAAN